MREILFISHRIPFPPDRGDKIRSHHILQRLSRLAPVHVATFADDDLDLAEEAELASIASSYRLVRRTKSLPVAGVQALAARCAVSLSAFYDRSLAEYVGRVLATRSISTIYVFSGQMGQYVPEDFKGQVIADFVDVDSAKFAAYAETHGGPLGWIYRREAELLRAEEARLARRANVSLLVSQAEVDLFVSRLPEEMRSAADVRVLGNGIDSGAFDPSMVVPETRMLDCPGPRLIFTGQMDYAPNVDAVVRAVDRIMPLIREAFPDATFHVVGRNPAIEVLDRHGRDGCHVWGRVDDIRPWLKSADLALVPLMIARGVQNKVLEAMSMALPIVLTGDAASGIDASDGHHYSIADSDEAIVESCIRLLGDERRARAQGHAARRFVTASASWQSMLADLPRIMGWSSRAVRDAA